MQRSAARFNLGLTDTGRAVVTGTVFVALAALIVPAFGVLSALVSVLATSLLVGFVLRPRIRITADMPDRVTAGRTVEITYTVRNLGRLPLYNLSITPKAISRAIEYPSDEHIIPHLAPDATAEVTVTIRALRRGHWQIKSPTCRSSFPFNLFRFAASTSEECTLVVLPHFSMLRINRTGSTHNAGADCGKIAGRAGLSAEYAGNRPFLPGDSLRTIDARAWARLSTPATREYQDELDSSVALILDTTPAHKTTAQSESGDIKELEAAVSLCASVAFTINGDRLIDFLLAGDNLHELTAHTRPLRLDIAHNILAGVEPSNGYPSRRTSEALAERFAEISEVFFILLRWNKAHQHLLELAENAGCNCTVLIVGPFDATDLDAGSLPHVNSTGFLSPDDILTGKIERL